MMLRTFNTIEEAMETWGKDAEARFKKRSKSGILCECQCYRREDRIPNPLRVCTLLLPEGIYNNYLKWTHERYMDARYKFPYVAILSPGNIRVRLHDNEKDNYGERQSLCAYEHNLDELLSVYLGKKIRVAKNILVKNSGT